MKKHGFITAHSEGEEEILLSFKPKTAEAQFVDDEPNDPLPGCNPHRHDSVHVDIVKPTRRRKGAIKVRWRVHSTRQIRWDVSGSVL